MCGIAGWVDFGRDLAKEPKVIEDMKQVQHNRGPDAGGSYFSRHAALGHRRLVVVDPAGGTQPMVRRQGDHTYVMVYNGELYNTAELRGDLENLGYTFSGHSDTEVLLTAYVAWGKDCLERLNGIFAFAIWEEPRNVLFLARDRLGVKPLFYAAKEGSFIFASEIKGLLAHPAVEPELDCEGLAEILVMAPSRTPGHGIFRDVRELKPGCCLSVSPAGITGEIPYWTLTSAPHTDSLDITAEKIRWLLEDAVARQLVADVPVATFLSGGLDSSALTAMAAKHYQRQGLGTLHSYSVDYAENNKYFTANRFQPDADAPWVRLVSERLGTLHHYTFLRPGDLAAALKAATLARDLPGMADVDSSLLLFCREVKKEVTVVLSGECADEVFGGYPWFTRGHEQSPGTFPWIRNLEQRMELFDPGIIATLSPQGYIARRFQEALDEVPRLSGETGEEAVMRELFYLNITRFMPTLLDRKDRMSMAAGLEARVPFCDHRLVEYVWNIPWKMKNHQGREKGILRMALQGVLPEDVLKRKKSPYPKTYHPDYLAAVRQGALEILADTTSPLQALIHPESVRNFVASDSAAVNFPWFGQLMGGPQLLAYLIQLNSWMKPYRVSIKL
jgi:asparagine synthase (glutamine-hydrolysing)